MLRNLLISIFFFFGPALLMLMLRNASLLMLLYLKRRQRRAKQQEVIDITPVDKQRAPNWFYIAVILLSLTCSITVFLTLQQSQQAELRHYVPAHSDASGRIVPGHWEPTPADSADARPEISPDSSLPATKQP